MRISIKFLAFTFTLFFTCHPLESFALRNTLSPDQIERLRTAKIINVQTIALTENGAVESDGIRNVVSDRLQALGFTVVQSPKEPSDVALKVKCEERRSKVAMSRVGGDADQPGTPSRIWNGPACQFTYRVDGQQGPWRQEVRTSFEDAWQEAQEHGLKDSGLYAMEQLKQALEQSDFPLRLLAEWKQDQRLASLLTAPTSSPKTKQIVLQLAKNTPGKPMLQALKTTMADSALAPDATRAMGYMGTAAAPVLLDLLEKSESVEIKASAAHALGEIGAHSGDITILPTLLAMMDAPQIDLGVQTEIVKAVGKIPDRKSVAPLKKLGVKAWTSRSPDPRMQDLREAIDWSLWQINPSAHTEE